MGGVNSPDLAQGLDRASRLDRAVATVCAWLADLDIESEHCPSADELGAIETLLAAAPTPPTSRTPDETRLSNDIAAAIIARFGPVRLSVRYAAADAALASLRTNARDVELAGQFRRDTTPAHPPVVVGLGRRFHEAAMRHDDRLTVGWDDLEQRQRDTYDAAAADVLATAAGGDVVAPRDPFVPGLLRGFADDAAMRGAGVAADLRQYADQYAGLLAAAPEAATEGGALTPAGPGCRACGMGGLVCSAHPDAPPAATTSRPDGCECGAEIIRCPHGCRAYLGPRILDLLNAAAPRAESDDAAGERTRDVRALRKMRVRMLDGDPIVDRDRSELARDMANIANRLQDHRCGRPAPEGEGDHATVDDVVLRDQAPRELGLTASDGAAPSVQVRVGDVLHDAAALDLLPTFAAVRMLGGPFWLAEKAAVTDAWLLPGDDGDGATAEALVACGGVRVLDLPSDGGGR